MPINIKIDKNFIGEGTHLKLLKRIFYTIAVIIILCCAVILICALNPSITRSLAPRIQQLFNTESTVGNLPVDSVINIPTGEDIGINWDKLQTDKIPLYVTPSREQINTPVLVSDKSGYQQIKEDATQIDETEGSQIEGTLSTGVDGESLTFDEGMYPYYAMLTEPMKSLYRQIYANAQALTTEFAPVVTVGVNQLKNVIEAVYNDHPELFWLETSYSCKYLQGGNCRSITLQYNQTAQYLDNAKQQFQLYAENILRDARNYTDKLQQEKYVHDMLTQNVEYDATAAMNQSAYSALVNEKTVCAGYARAFQYLMQQLNIPCYYCTGYSGQDHAWNIIEIDGVYYNVDVTWDDTDPLTYDYYNKTDTDFAGTHIRTSMSVYLPACVGATVVDNTSDYVNPNPQKPLTWDDPNQDGNSDKEDEKELRENLEEAGITEDEVMETLEEYYKDCLAQTVKKGAGMQQFTNVIPESLWRDVELLYNNENYKAGYADEALKQLNRQNFAIQLQGQRLGGGYYRLYHNISIW